MKIDHIAEGSPQCPLIRVYGTSLGELVRLREQARFLGDMPDRSVSLRADPAFSFGNLSDLQLDNSASEGITIDGDAAHWRLSRPDWHVVCGLIDGMVDMADGEEGHNWLTGPEAQDPLAVGEISLLLSRSHGGTW